MRTLAVLGPVNALFLAAACGGEAGSSPVGSPDGAGTAGTATSTHGGGSGGLGGNGMVGPGPFESKGISALPHDCSNDGIGTCCDYDFCLDAEDAEKALHNGAGAGGDGPDIAQACQVSNLSLGFCTFLEAAPIVKDGKCCFSLKHGTCCGRPFVVGGVPRQGEVVQRGDWCGEGRRAAVDTTLPAEARAELASAWLEDALLEHASIASFARFSLELLGVGAPASLVEAAQRASLDETRHAYACFALASRLGGRDLGPGRLAMHGLELERGLAELAVAVLREGAIGETLAAALAQRQLDSAVDEQCREALAVIAADEAEHSLLAWRFLRYAIERGGSHVFECLRGALDSAPRQPSPRQSKLAASTLNHYGRLTPEQERDVIEETWREVIGPAAAMLLAPTKPSDVLALS